MSNEFFQYENSQSSLNGIIRSLDQLKLLEKAFESVISCLENRSKDQTSTITNIKEDVYCLLGDDLMIKEEIDEQGKVHSIQNAFLDINKSHMKVSSLIPTKGALNHENGYSQKSKASKSQQQQIITKEKGFKIFNNTTNGFPQTYNKAGQKSPDKKLSKLSNPEPLEIQGMSGASNSHRKLEKESIKKPNKDLHLNSNIVRGSFHSGTISSKGKVKPKENFSEIKTTPKRRDLSAASPSSNHDHSYSTIHKKVAASNEKHSQEKTKAREYVAKPEYISDVISNIQIKSSKEKKPVQKSSGSIMKESEFLQKFQEKSLIPNTQSTHKANVTELPCPLNQPIREKSPNKEEENQEFERIEIQIAVQNPKHLTEDPFENQKYQMDFKIDSFIRKSIDDLYNQIQKEGIREIETDHSSEQMTEIVDYIQALYGNVKVEFEQEKQFERIADEKFDALQIENYIENVYRNSVVDQMNFPVVNESPISSQKILEEKEISEKSEEENNFIPETPSEFLVGNYISNILHSFQINGIPPLSFEVKVSSCEEEHTDLIRQSINEVYQKLFFNVIEEEKKMNNLQIVEERKLLTLYSDDKSEHSVYSEIVLENEFNETFIWKYMEEIYTGIEITFPNELNIEEEKECLQYREECQEIDKETIENYLENTFQKASFLVLNDSQKVFKEEESKTKNDSDLIQTAIGEIYQRASFTFSSNKKVEVSQPEEEVKFDTTNYLQSLYSENLNLISQINEPPALSNFELTNLVRNSIDNIYSRLSFSNEAKDEHFNLDEIKNLAKIQTKEIIKRVSNDFSQSTNYDYSIENYLSEIVSKILIS